MKKGKFITLEGGEGVGKSTAMQFLKRYFESRQRSVILTREPGGTEIAEAIRQVVLSPNFQEKMTPETELLLMFAARAQHVATVIRPQLAAGNIVISDRYVDTSFVYQGVRGMPESRIATLAEWVAADVTPDLTILLDAPPEIGRRRAEHRTADRIESEALQFFREVRQAYLARAAAEPERFWIVDATQPIAAVEAQLQAAIETRL